MTGLGVFLIIAAVIASTNIHLVAMSLYDWVVLLVLIFGGAALLAKVLLVGDCRDDKEDKGGYRSRKSQRRQSDASKSRSYSSAAIDVEAELEAMKKGK